MKNQIIEEDLEYITKAVSSDLLDLSGQRLLVTGGTGFIGSYILETIAKINEHILTKPCRTFVLTRNRHSYISRRPSLASRKDIVFLEGDARSYDYSGVECDYIIHGATPADLSTVKTHPLDIMETISGGTLNLLRNASEKEVKSFLFISSGAVYGSQPPKLKRIPEGFLQGPDLGKPSSGYAEGKRYAEVLCSIFKEEKGVPVKIARPFTFMGPYQSLSAGYAATEFIRNCLNREPIKIKSDGRVIRSYCYSADLTVALLKVLLNGNNHPAYNVGSDEEISVASLAEKIAACFDYETEIIVEGRKSTELPPRYLPDISLLRRDYKYTPHYAIDDTINRTVKWFQQQVS